MSNKIAVFLSILLLLVFVPFTFAQSENSRADEVVIPEKDGTYDVPGRPNMKVRVFVHNPKFQNSNALVACAADNNSNALVGATGWHLPSTWTYELNVNSTPLNLATIADNAFNAWEGPSGVNFTRGANTNIDRKGLDGHNIVAWGRTSGNALGVTYTWYYTATGDVAEVDTIMNKKFSWGWSTNTCNNSYYDAQDILTHELGHWMGLEDEYATNYVDHTMYGYGARGEIKKNTLTTGDVDGINAIY